MQLSIILITLNAEAHIARCLRSLSFPTNLESEMIVVDGGSQDRTVAICERMGARVYEHKDWLGFGVQKNRALAYARGAWVLSLDADEELTETLREEIYQALMHPQYEVYRFPRLSNYCGRWMHHSGWRPDYIVRLFKRGAAQFSTDLVHERLLFAPSLKVGTLHADLLHYSYSSLEEVMGKMNHYSSAGAQRQYARGKRSSLGKAIVRAWWAFIRTYVLRRGFLDGTEGLILAISNAEGTYYRHLKLRELQRIAALDQFDDPKIAPSPELSISVVVTTYNRPSALFLVLRALSEQTLRPFEVIVADVGSHSDTKTAVDALSPELPFKLRYCWQADQGFRAARARNLAAAAATGEYLIFLDGDCLPLPDFIARHATLARPHYMVSGNRVLLNAPWTHTIEEAQAPVWRYSLLQWLGVRCRGRINRLFPLTRIRLSRPKRIQQRWQGAKTCNLAMWREDFIAVNGFDESFMGWGHEDADLVVRLIRHGVRRQDGCNQVPVLHLWHKESDRSQEPQARARLEATIAAQYVRAPLGLDQHLQTQSA